MARQRLGQHFLVKGRILERIAMAACGDHAPLVVEIGPGRGALTEHLLGHAERVVGIELDTALAGYVREHWLGDSRLEIVEANALDADWSQWGDGVLVGNLPYYAATAIISRYVHNPGSLKHGVFLIQKEVAERITAQPGGREYGYLSVECQLLAQAEYLFTVGPGAFRPPPKVESAVIRLTPRTTHLIQDTRGFLSFASLCFRQKRKTLRNNLAVAYPAQLYQGRPEISRRAEQLSVEELAELYRSLGGVG
ncbi:MAG TPA: 16S rRNA (adenine(1518)-N(6)/adenine(1519)-N(6))-dimethyltransferase RsmA [Bryobacteraceae bacterium]|nr:16S rRNA (adenine(1518)-N(6)/adenine(1519)-N(6))-dimethyltransferase RsmA [Bryobacteraceae bacterium]